MEFDRDSFVNYIYNKTIIINKFQFLFIYYNIVKILDIIIESIYKPINLLFNNPQTDINDYYVTYKIKDDNYYDIDYDIFYEKYIFCKKFKLSLYNTFYKLIPNILYTKLFNYYKSVYLTTLESFIYYKLIIKNEYIVNIEFIDHNNYININRIDNIYVYDFILDQHYYNMLTYM